MGSYVADNRNRLGRRHYVRKAGAGDYWFSVYYNRVRRYQNDYGDDFCLVLYGSDSVDDAYVIPFRVVASLFTPSSLYPDDRWIGSIKSDSLDIRNAGSVSVAPYYNAFHLL